MIGPYELLIAATALHHGRRLAPLNRDEFARVPALRFIDPTPFGGISEVTIARISKFHARSDVGPHAGRALGLGMHLTQVTKKGLSLLMTREAESQLLAFCAAQRDAFDSSAWASFDAVSALELAATARYLAGVDWFGHQKPLARVADQLTTLNFEELARTVDFDPGRFKSLLCAHLVHADNLAAR